MKHSTEQENRISIRFISNYLNKVENICLHAKMERMERKQEEFGAINSCCFISLTKFAEKTVSLAT